MDEYQSLNAALLNRGTTLAMMAATLAAGAIQAGEVSVDELTDFMCADRYVCAAFKLFDAAMMAELARLKLVAADQAAEGEQEHAEWLASEAAFDEEEIAERERNASDDSSTVDS